jgi:hypothetical protein
MSLCVKPRLQTGLFLLAFVASVSSNAIAQSDRPPATAPASTATASAPENLKTLLLQLSDRDPNARAAAHEQLLGLSPDDLPNLRTAVEQMRPLPPGDANAIRDIVKHVFLVGQNVQSDSDQGFMGITMEDLLPFDAEQAADDPDFLTGVVVQGRLPGFDAYRALRDGDIILTIAAPGGLPLAARGTEIQNVVKTLSAGQVVRLEVLRHGRRTEASVTLNPRPRDLPVGAQTEVFSKYRTDRENKFQVFWLARFAAIVDDNIS